MKVNAFKLILSRTTYLFCGCRISDVGAFFTSSLQPLMVYRHHGIISQGGEKYIHSWIIIYFHPSLSNTIKDNQENWHIFL